MGAPVASGERFVPASSDRLPPEVLRFLSAGSPQTLTVRGPPGAGKSTFALTVLDQFVGYRAYVSTRVSRASVLRDHPWAAPPDRPVIDIVETLRYRGGAGSENLQVGSLRDALQARANDLVDLSTVLALPDALSKGLASREGDPKLVVIDSWEAWIESCLGPSPLALDVPTTRWELERSLLDQLLGRGAHVLLVVERAGADRMDYVADGALSLSVADSDGRAERWLTFQKLRGIRIGSVSYPFTLEAGRFQCIQPSQFQVPAASVPDQADPGPDVPGLWPGCTALATRFGRFPVPGSALIEADAETPASLLLRLVVPMINTALRSGGRVVFRPPSHFSSREIWQAFGGIHARPELSNSLRILSWDSDNGLSGMPGESFLKVVGEGPAESRRIVDLVDSTGFLRAPLPARGRSLVVLFMDSALDSGGAAGDPQSFLALVTLARQSGNAFGMILVSRSGEPFIEPIRSRSALHLLVHSSRGQFFLTGIRPWTPHFVLTRPPVAQEASVPYGLVPVV